MPDQTCTPIDAVSTVKQPKLIAARRSVGVVLTDPGEGLARWASNGTLGGDKHHDDDGDEGDD
jgi:hypothetical protein